MKSKSKAVKSENPYSKFSRLIDFFDQFLIENQSLYVPDQYLKRLQSIASKAEKMNAIKPQSERLSSTLVKNNLGQVVCDRCGVVLNPKNVNKHQTRCKPINTERRDPLDKLLQPADKGLNQKTRSPGVKKNGQANFDLDQSKDTFQHRESGRFGSLPSFDDFGDESFA